MSRDNIKAYLLTTFGIVAIIALYYLFAGSASMIQPNNGQPPNNGQIPRGVPDQTPVGMPGFNLFDAWPLWGQFLIPSLNEIVISISILMAFGLAVVYLYRRTDSRPRIFLLVIVGLLLIIATNLIHGWQTGIVEPIAGASEIFSDMFRVDNVLDFIGNYENLQQVLSLHAQTQPPGAVLTIYLLYVIFNDPSLIAIGLCVISVIGSTFFLRGIARQLFDETASRYMVFIYLLLPAVQVYYLANIYAIVATLSLGVLYFYLHSDRRIAALGSFITLFLLTFITFLSAFMIFFLFIYEIMRSRSEIAVNSEWDRLRTTLRYLRTPALLSLCVAALYGVLLVTLGFNYVNAFLYASSLENPNGFMLLSSPVQYIMTRIQDILDIVIFFGPVLSVLAYRGLRTLREEAKNNVDSSKKYNIVISALVALGLLFLTGAPKKGETARICMFILPFLLIPVIAYIQSSDMSRREKIILLALVFVQAVLLQLMGTWLW